MAAQNPDGARKTVERNLDVREGGQGTISLWLRAPEKLERRHYYFVKYPRLYIYLWEGQGAVFELTDDSQENKAFVSARIPPDLEWHHLAAVWYKKHFCLYVDGELASTKIAGLDLPDVDPHRQVRVGNERLSVKGLRIHARALVGKEIKNLAARPEHGLAGPEEGPPLISVGRTGAPPVIDGKLDDECWTSCMRAGGFTTLVDNRLAARETEVSVCYDRERIFFGVRCQARTTDRLVAEARARDAVMWGDDHVEIFLQDAGAESYWQFVVNPNGALWDARAEEVEANEVKSKKSDPAWNAGCAVAARREGDFWSVELELPFAAIGGVCPAASEKWRANFARDDKTTSELSCWAPAPKHSFGDMETWGTMVFRAETPGFDMLEVPTVNAGENQCTAVILNGAASPKRYLLTMRIMPFARESHELILKPGERRKVSADLRIAKLPAGKTRGLFELIVSAPDTDECLFYHPHAARNRFAEMYILDEKNVLDDTIHIARDYPAYQRFHLRHNFETEDRRIHGVSVVKKACNLIFDVPDGIGILNAEKGKTSEKDGRRYTRHTVALARIANNRSVRVLFGKSGRDENEITNAYYHLECGECVQPRKCVKIKTITIGSTRAPSRLYTGLYDFTVASAARWLPDWTNDLKKLGLNTISTSVHGKSGSEELVEKARREGFMLRNEYFFPISPETSKRRPDARSWMEWTENDPEARAVTIDGGFIRNPHYNGAPYMLCPSYRGREYRRTMDAFLKGGFIQKCKTNWFAFDLELWSSDEGRICFCRRCVHSFKEYLAERRPDLPFVPPTVFEKTPDEFPEHHRLWRDHFGCAFNQTLRAMKGEIAEVTESAGLGKPVFVEWHRFNEACDLIEYGLYDQPRNLTNFIDEVKERHRGSRTAFAFNPTFGQMSPNYKDMGVTAEDVKYLTLEAAAAGAKGIYYFSFTSIGDALRLKNIVDALRMIAKVEDIVLDGESIDSALSSSNASVRTRGLAKGDRALILVAEYKTKGLVATEVAFKPGRVSIVVDLATDRPVAEISPSQPTFRISLDQERAKLFLVKP